MKNDVMVSVFCTVYNHEKYIRKCLDGFIAQKTDFKFEVLVHDDASTDNSADIIREYEEKYPEIIRPIYQTENQYSQGIGITKEFFLPIARGKYFAWCEGDDYWLDPNKLQKQFEILEQNLDCSMCVCKVQNVSEDGEHNCGTIPQFKLNSGTISSESSIKMLCNGYPFQTSSFFVRGKEYRVFNNEECDFKKMAPEGDLIILLYFAQLGNIYYLDEIMSCYRLSSVSSVERRKKLADSMDKLQPYRDIIAMIEDYDKYTAYKYHDVLLDYRFRMEVRRLSIEGKYREILRPENEQLLHVLTRKQKVDIILRAYLPNIYPSVYNMYRRLRNLPEINEGR